MSLYISVFKCNFVALKTTGRLYRQQLFSKIWALFLLVAFLNASLIESFHHHGSLKSASYIQKTAKTDHHSSIFSGQLKCKLCDLIKHSAHFYHLPVTASYSVLSTELAIKYVALIELQPSVFILGCTNKGPPSF